jgi:hypothetical protein
MESIQFSQILGLLAVLILVVLAVPFYFVKRQFDYYEKRAWTIYPRALISEEYEKLCTGDLILFSPLVTIPIISVTTLHELTHVGMVIREQTDIIPGLARCLLTETGGGVPPGINPDYVLGPGVVVTPLLARLKNYPGRCYLMKLAQPLTAAAAAAIVTEAYAHVGEPYPKYLEFVTAVLAHRPLQHCYGFVADLLAAGGAAHIDRQAGVPLLSVIHNVLALAGPGKVYEPIREILYDIDAHLQDHWSVCKI